MSTSRSFFFKDIKKDQLKCFILSGKGEQCLPSFRGLYQASYELWKKVMGYALQYESKIKEPNLTSDEFIRQKEVIVVFLAEQPIGLCLLAQVDISFESTLEHSYFQDWPTSIFTKLRAAGLYQLSVASNLVIDHQWRRSKVGRGVSELVFGLTVKQFMNAKTKALITFTRNDRGTDRLVYNFGGIPLMESHLSHGIASDIILIEKKMKALNIPLSIKNMIDVLYDCRIIAVRDKDFSIADTIVPAF